MNPPFEDPVMFVLPRLNCLRCGYVWMPRKETRPRICPTCKTPYWDRELTQLPRSKGKLVRVHCKCCGYEWTPLRTRAPRECPSCKSHHWNGQ